MGMNDLRNSHPAACEQLEPRLLLSSGPVVMLEVIDNFNAVMTPGGLGNPGITIPPPNSVTTTETGLSPDVAGGIRESTLTSLIGPQKINVNVTDGNLNFSAGSGAAQGRLLLEYGTAATGGTALGDLMVTGGNNKFTLNFTTADFEGDLRLSVEDADGTQGHVDNVTPSGLGSGSVDRTFLFADFVVDVPGGVADIDWTSIDAVSLRIDGAVNGDYTMDHLITQVDAQAGVDIEKATNGHDADNPTGPFIPLGDQVTWTYVVTNTGNVALGSVTVTDDQGVVPVFQGGDTDGDGLLDVDEVWTYEAVGTGAAGQYENISTVVGNPVYEDGADITELDDVTDEDPSHYFGADPAIDIEKATNGHDADNPTGPFIPVGDTVTWTYVVTNTGNVDLVNVVVTDDHLGVLPGASIISQGNGDAVLDVGESWTYEMPGTAAAGQYANLSDVEGEDPTGEKVTDEDPSHYFGADPAIDIEKATNGHDADSPTGPIVGVGDTVTWTYVVTNTGNVDLTDIVVTDDQLGAVTNITDQGNGDAVLAVGEIWTYEMQGTAVAGQYANLSDVRGEDSTGTEVTDEDPSHYFAETLGEPGIDIEKLTNGADADNVGDPDVPLIAPGDTVTWTYQVTNTGAQPFALADVVVTDDNGTPGDTSDDFHPDFVPSSDVGSDGILSPGEQWLYTATAVAQDLGGGQCGGGVYTFQSPKCTLSKLYHSKAYRWGIDPDIPQDEDVVGATLEIKGIRNYENAANDLYVSLVDDLDHSVPGTPAAPLGVSVYYDGGAAGNYFSSWGMELEHYEDLSSTSQTLTYVFDQAEIDALNALLDANPDNIGITADSDCRYYVTCGFVLTLDTVKECPPVCYENYATVVAGSVSDIDPSHYCNPIDAGVDIEKYVKGVSEGGEGLTPGFWKQSHHLKYWTGYTKWQKYEDVFGVDVPGSCKVSGDPTLLQALGARGGGVYALLRHSTAALLNAANTNVSYAYTEAQIIAMVQDAFATGQYEAAKSLFEAQNELGADLSNGGGSGVGFDINDLGDDADLPDGPEIPAGETVFWTYVVTNTGEVELANVTVTDDNGTPGDTSDDFAPDPVLAGGFNIGDADHDNKLDVDETWYYTATATAVEGLFTNMSMVTATPVCPLGIPIGQQVTDSDPANYHNVPPQPVSGIDIEKYVRKAPDSCWCYSFDPKKDSLGDDADEPQGPTFYVGTKIMWVYTVTNTGETELADVTVTDDNGTPGDTGDDFNPKAFTKLGQNIGDADKDGRLDPGETWYYSAKACAEAGQNGNVGSVIGTPVNQAGDRIDADVTDSDAAWYYGKKKQTCPKPKWWKRFCGYQPKPKSKQWGGWRGFGKKGRC